MEASAGVAWPNRPRQRVVKQMEHPIWAAETGEAESGTGPTGAAETGEAEAGAGLTRAAGAGPSETGAGETGAREAGAGVAGAPGAPDQTPAAATGQPRVDAAVRLLDRLPGLPVSEHSELFEQVHAQLSEVLGELDSGAGGPAGPAGG